MHYYTTKVVRPEAPGLRADVNGPVSAASGVGSGSTHQSMVNRLMRFTRDELLSIGRERNLKTCFADKKEYANIMARDIKENDDEYSLQMYEARAGKD